MKRIYISLSIIIAVFILAAVETGYISAKADSYIFKIENTDKLMLKDNFSEAINLCSSIEESWDNSAKKIDMFLIHDYVDNIGDSISKMRAYAENGSVDMYFAESSAAKKELASIKESEYPLIENIL